MSRVFNSILLSAAAFATGYAAASLLNPKSGKENRKWLTDQSKETKNWIEDKSQKLVKESEKRIDKISEGIKKTVNENLPDLYEATEGLVFDENGEK